MAKRGATSELNHDNWNEDEESEEAGTFQQAPADVLKTRVIRQAKRRAGGEDKSANVFAGFGGFGAGSAAKPATSLFSFLGQTATPQVKTPSADEPATQVKKPVSDTDENGNEEEYLSSLRVLNETVTSWVAEHVKKNPCCVLTPIFSDYEKHLKTLEEKRKSKKSPAPQVSSAETSASAPTAAPAQSDTGAKAASFVFGKALEARSEASAKSDTGAKATPFLFGKAPESDKAESDSSSSSLSLGAGKGSIFSGLATSSSTTATSTFSFALGAKPLSTSTSAPFTFGATSTTPAAPFSFGFGGLNKPAAAEKKEDDKEGDNAENDEDTPPKVEIAKVEEDDSFYSIRCKLFYKKENAFTEKGVGMLFLKKVSGGEKTQLIVRAETTLGNILLNVMLTPALTTQRMGKNNVMMVCVPNPPIDAKTPAVPTPMLFRVKSAEDADDLLKTLEDAKK